MNRIFLYLVALLLPAMVFSQRRMEYLNQALVAMPDGRGAIFVSWRMLATDPADVAFNLYRSVNNGKESKVGAPITATTSWLNQGTDLINPRIPVSIWAKA